MRQSAASFAALEIVRCSMMFVLIGVEKGVSTHFGARFAAHKKGCTQRDLGQNGCKHPANAVTLTCTIIPGVSRFVLLDVSCRGIAVVQSMFAELEAQVK